MKRFFTALTMAVLATAAPAFADTQSTPILDLIDRPTVTQSTYVLAPNQVLVEAGYNNTSFPSSAFTSGGSTATYPQAEVRVGTQLKNLEVDVTAPSVIRGSGVTSGTDIAAGVKYLIHSSKRFAVSAQFDIDAPTGQGQSPASFGLDGGGSVGGTQNAFALNGTYNITKVFSVKTTQKLTLQNIGGLHYTSYTPSFVLAAALPYQTSIFAEYASATKFYGPSNQFSSATTRTQYLLGASHAISPRLAIDVEGTSSPSVNNYTKYTGIGVGAAYQI